MATPLSGQQGERGNPRIQDDCRRAAQVLRTGHPAPRRAWALDAIRRCGESGAAVIAGVWERAAPSDPSELRHLFEVTREFNDRGVVDAVAKVARQADAPDVTRIYAFALLFSYAVPGQYIVVQDLLVVPEGRGPGMAWESHDDAVKQTRPLLGDLRPEVAGVLRAVVETEPSSRAGVAAATVLSRLANFQ